jgi:hypothetical protein
MAILPNLNIPSFTTNLGLLASFDKTSLDVEDSNYIYTVPPTSDASTSYPQYTTGTPTLFSTPGYPQRYTQRWFPGEQYLDAYYVGNGDSAFTEDLGNGQTTFDITNFDVENDNPYGFFLSDFSTVYSSNVTGTPILGANPGPPRRYTQRFLPSRPYISIYPVNGLISRFTEDLGRGQTTFNITNFDLENRNPNGFHSRDTSTAYGVYVTGTPTIYANPAYPQRFVQQYYPHGNRQYLDIYSIAGNSRFTDDLGNGLNTLDISNFDVERLTTYPQDTITNYPVLTSGTPNLLSNPGPANLFVQKWLPEDTYLFSYPIKGESRFTKNLSNGKNTFDMTDLDTEAPGVNGGIPYNQQKDPTIYPVTTNGATPVRGYFATPGKPVSKFNQVYSASNTYSDFINAYI